MCEPSVNERIMVISTCTDSFFALRDIMMLTDAEILDLDEWPTTTVVEDETQADQ